MDGNMRAVIENIVNNIRRTVNISPEETRDINGWNKIVTKLGGEIIEDPNLFCDAEIIKNEPKGPAFSIRISPYQSDTRKNFSIAHEIGHLFLHMLYLIDNDYWNNLRPGESYKRMGSSEIESQANEFAAEILMPKEYFLSVLNENKLPSGNEYNIGPVARKFNVSEQAAINRGRWLGVLAW